MLKILLALPLQAYTFEMFGRTRSVYYSLQQWPCAANLLVLGFTIFTMNSNQYNFAYCLVAL